MATGPLPQADRDRLVQLTARFASVDEAQARQRIDQLEADLTPRLRATEEQARAVANTAAAFIGARVGTPNAIAIIRRFRTRNIEPA